VLVCDSKLPQNPVLLTVVRETLLPEYHVGEREICTMLAELADKGLVDIQEGA
jgi:hypothetical protein